MILTDKLNTLALACTFLIQERELVQQQEVTVVAAKVFRNQALRQKYYTSVKDWLPSQDYLSYTELREHAPLNN